MYTPKDFENWKSLNGIDKVMFENMCVESHARDAIENGFDVIILSDATAAAGDAAYEAALTNFEFLAHDRPGASHVAV